MSKSKKATRADVDYLIGQLKAAKVSAQNWRKQYEELSLTPAIKADVEGAFARGVEHGRKQTIAYLLTELQAGNSNGDTA